MCYFLLCFLYFTSDMEPGPDLGWKGDSEDVKIQMDGEDMLDTNIELLKG